MADLKISQLTTTADPDGLLIPGARAGINFKFDVGAIQDSIDAHIADNSGAHAGSAISFTPIGGIAATNVSDALEELDVEKASLNDLTFKSNIIAIIYSGALNRADNTNYYHGKFYSAVAGSAATTRRFKFVRAGIITNLMVNIVSTTNNPSNEAVSLFLRLNNTTNFLLCDLDYSQIPSAGITGAFYFTIVAPITVTTTDYYEVLEAVPAMVTNPSNVSISIELLTL